VAELTSEMLGLCDYITPHETEATALTEPSVHTVEDAEKAAARLYDMGVGTPIITLGERGAYLFGHGNMPAGSVVETTSTGDAFNGEFATELANRAIPFEAVRIACAKAVLSATGPGA